MTPTINGRIQSRFFLLFIIAPIWTLVLTPFLGGMGDGFLQVYWNAFQVLVWVAVLGVLWELLWHFLQQFRWEKDWPIMFGLFQFIPEGILIFFIVNQNFLGLTTGGGVPTGPFLLHFITTVLVTWTWIIGPHRIFFIRWRYQGGRLV
ncbi:hypothetical protein BH23ACT9_BH23ACT9_18170 [soil metagenome]